MRTSELSTGVQDTRTRTAPPTSTGRARSFGMGCASDLGRRVDLLGGGEQLGAVQAAVDGDDLEVLRLALGKPGQLAAVARHGYRARAVLRRRCG